MSEEKGSGFLEWLMATVLLTVIFLLVEKLFYIIGSVFRTSFGWMSPKKKSSFDILVEREADLEESRESLTRSYGLAYAYLMKSLKEGTPFFGDREDVVEKYNKYLHAELVDTELSHMPLATIDGSSNSDYLVYLRAQSLKQPHNKELSRLLRLAEKQLVAVKNREECLEMYSLEYNLDRVYVDRALTEERASVFTKKDWDEYFSSITEALEEGYSYQAVLSLLMAKEGKFDKEDLSYSEFLMKNDFSIKHLKRAFSGVITYKLAVSMIELHSTGLDWDSAYEEVVGV